VEPPPPPADAPTFRTMDAIRSALEAELAADDRVFVAGIDVGAGGNVFGLTRGLADQFGDRVRDTPISETAIIGLGVGAAMAGMRPVVEMMYLDFLGVCFDQLLNQAAKLPFMTGGSRGDGPDRADPVRRRALLGEPALAEPRGAAGPHPRAERRHALDTGRHLRAAPGGHPGPEPGGVHREPAALRHEGPQPPADHILPIGRSAVVRPEPT
jgi:2-oxoisovalerate dehydrogenase E1 component